MIEHCLQLCWLREVQYLYLSVPKLRCTTNREDGCKFQNFQIASKRAKAKKNDDGAGKL